MYKIFLESLIPDATYGIIIQQLPMPPLQSQSLRNLEGEV